MEITITERWAGNIKESQIQLNPGDPEESIYIGESDIAQLILQGYTSNGVNGVEVKALHMGRDGSYSARIIARDWTLEKIVTGTPALDKNYYLVEIYYHWFKILDDTGANVEFTFSDEECRAYVYQNCESGKVAIVFMRRLGVES